MLKANPSLTHAHTHTSILLGVLFLNAGMGSEGIQNRIGYFFFLAINSTFGFVMPTISVFPDQRTIMKRERAAGTYRASSAYIAKVMSTVPVVLLGAVILVIPAYWMIGLQPFADRYFTYVTIILIHALTANSLGLAIGSLVPNAIVGNIVAPLLTVLMLLFGGQLINRTLHPYKHIIYLYLVDTLTPVLSWLQYLSIIAHTNKALVCPLCSLTPLTLSGAKRVPRTSV